MKKQQKIFVILTAVFVAAVAIGAVVTGDGSDLQGRFQFNDTPAFHQSFGSNEPETATDYQEILDGIEDELAQLHDQAYNAFLIGNISGLDESDARDQYEIIEEQYEAAMLLKPTIMDAMDGLNELEDSSNRIQAAVASSVYERAVEMYTMTLEIEGYYVDMGNLLESQY